MSKKIFVGNLSFQITETDLTNMFGEIGQVESVQIITDRDTGRSKGFGFVQMADDAERLRWPRWPAPILRTVRIQPADSSLSLLTDNGSVTAARGRPGN